MKNNDFLLYGEDRKKEETEAKREEIIERYFEISSQIKDFFSRTERKALETVFDRLRNFETLIKKDNKIKLIEPFFRSNNKPPFKSYMRFFVKG